MSGDLDESFNLEAMSATEVSAWMNRQGIPQKYCDIFEENYIDGTEFIDLTEDVVKSLVPPIGLVKKIMKLRSKSNVDAVLCGTPSSISTRSSLDDAGSSSSNAQALLRDPEEIPTRWCPEVDDCILQCSLSDSARCEIVRVLVNQLFARMREPKRVNCEHHARKLILKYPFMKDDMGNGYQSWVDKMITRVRNLKKKAKKKRPNSDVDQLPDAKRKKSPLEKGKELLLRRYPVGVEVSVNDADSLEVHEKAISDELAKPKPRDSVLLPLLKSTYHERRLYIQSEATCVKEILGKYPALRHLSIMDQEMQLIVGKEVKSLFLAEWQKYVPAIVEYAKKSGKKGVLRRTLDLAADQDGGEEVELAALKAVVQALVKADVLPYIYEEYEIESMDEAYRKAPLRNSPRIGVFKNDARSQYFIMCEQFTLCEVPTLKKALFYMFSAYYIFNLEYPKPAQTVFYFLQDYVLSYPDSMKRPSTYLAVMSDIKHNLC